MRTTIGYTLESIGYVIGAQGLISFVSMTFFGAEWGWMHKVVDLSSTACLGVVVVALALVVGGVKTRKAPGRRGAA
ncbi:hypothetical protein ABT143_13530 [Streptomyces sp. NPDC002033]|uniref:hypothetical protein n=1 Tax=unclassified Streptomyces TaxID=2593676 RepID=UPI00331BBC6D